MNQMTTSRESGNLTIVVDFPRQPFTVRAAALDLRDGRQPTFSGQLRHYSSAADYWSEPGNREAHGKLMIAYWSDPKNREAHGEAMTKHWSDSKNGEAHGEAMTDYWSDPKSTEQHEKLNELMIAQWKAQPFNPEAKYHT